MTRFLKLKYLKHVGSQMHVKVTLYITRDNVVEIHIRDCVFYEFSQALNYLKSIAASEQISYVVHDDDKGE